MLKRKQEMPLTTDTDTSRSPPGSHRCVRVLRVPRPARSCQLTAAREAAPDLGECLQETRMSSVETCHLGARNTLDDSHIHDISIHWEQ